MRRRAFLGLLTGAATFPVAAHGQPHDRVRRIGVFIGLGQGDLEGKKWADTLVKSLQDLGWVQGKNLQIDLRWGASDVTRMRSIANELVALSPEVIAVSTTPATTAILETKTRIPVVFSAVSDPIGANFVTNLARPGGNVTGFMNLEGTIGGKWVELLKEVAPQIANLAILYNPATANPQFAYYRRSVEAASTALGITTQSVPWENTSDLEQALVALTRERHAGLIVIPTPHTVAQRELIVSFTNRNRIPGVYPFSFWVRGGGLISYGVDLADLHRRAGVYVDRILNGTAPGDLPVQLPTKFEMAVNLKTATALGLTVPPTMLGRADEVIE